MAKRGERNKNSRKSCKQTPAAAEEVDIKTYDDAEKLMEVICRITKERSDPSFPLGEEKSRKCSGVTRKKR